MIIEVDFILNYFIYHESTSNLELACMAPLGLENGKIKATAIITRFYSTKNYARVSRTSNGSAWHFGPFPSDGQFIQFDLGTGLTKVTGIGIQGEHVWFVTRYTVSYSEDGDDWRDIIENGKTKVSRKQL